MSGFELNKIAGAVLLAGLTAIIVGKVSDALYHEDRPASARGYQIEGAEIAAADAGAGAATAPEQPVDILPFLAKADAASGAASLKKCTACHTFDKGGKNGVGPNQWGLAGRKIASVDGYAYSAALAAMKDKHWGFQELSDFLANPKKFAPGNKMAFAGIKDPQERANLIAHLNALSDSPLPLPK